jgi:hypothetical protein
MSIDYDTRPAEHFEEPAMVPVSVTVNRAGAAVTILAGVWTDGGTQQYSGEYRIDCGGCGPGEIEYHPDPADAEASGQRHAQWCGKADPS